MVPGGCSGADGTGATAGFSDSIGITTNGTNLYVVDDSSNNVRQVVIATNEMTTLAGAPAGVNTSGATDGTGTTARFARLWSITTDGFNLYVTDLSNQKIRKIVIATGDVSSLTGAPNQTVAAGTSDGFASSAQFRFSWGITTDGTNVYVTDFLTHTIRKIQYVTPPSNG
jgi:hypothetical protein